LPEIWMKYGSHAEPLPVCGSAPEILYRISCLPVDKGNFVNTKVSLSVVTELLYVNVPDIGTGGESEVCPWKLTVTSCASARLAATDKRIDNRNGAQ